MHDDVWYVIDLLGKRLQHLLSGISNDNWRILNQTRMIIGFMPMFLRMSPYDRLFSSENNRVQRLSEASMGCKAIFFELNSVSHQVRADLTLAVQCVHAVWK